MEERSTPLTSSATALRLALAAFVLAWILGPSQLRTAIPIWLPFAIALGLEVWFFVSAVRAGPQAAPDRRPQAVDRDRFGYGGDTGDLLLVRRGGEELWIPYAGETDDDLDELIADAEARAREGGDDEEDEEPQPAAPRLARPLLPIRRLAAGLAVIGGLAALLWLVESRTGWQALDADDRARAAARFSEEASRIAGKRVLVRCDESGEHVGAVQHADGVAVVGGTLTYLTPERCLDLYRLAYQGEVRPSQTGRALAVLAHEAWHLRGVADEARTECYALQSGVELGRRLGLSEERARQLMRQQLAENVLRRRSSPAYVVPGDCRDGGRLDLDPAGSRFP